MAATLYEAARLGRLETVQAIVGSRKYARQAAVRGEHDGGTALHAACEGGHDAVVRALLEKSASAQNVNASNRHGQSPLHLASEHGHLDCARLLLDADADARGADAQGCTPLIRACLHGRTPVVKLLLGHDREVVALDQTDASGMTALYRACVSGHEACVGALLDAGALLQPDAEGAKQLALVLGKSREKGHLGCVGRIEDALRSHADRLAAGGGRVRIKARTSLVGKQFSFLLGEEGALLRYDAAACEARLQLDNPRFGQLSVHPLALEPAAGPAPTTATASAAAPSPAVAEGVAASEEEEGGEAAARQGEGSRAAEVAAQQVAAQLLAEEEASKGIAAPRKDGRDGRDGKPRGRLDASQHPASAVGAARPAPAHRQDAAAPSDGANEEEQRREARQRERALALAAAWRDQETARQLAEKAARQGAAAAAAERAKAMAQEGDSARRQPQPQPPPPQPEPQLPQPPQQQPPQPAAARRVDCSGVDAAEVGLAAMRAAMRSVQSAGAGEPPPMAMAAQPTPNVAAIVRFATANAAANASHEAWLLAANVANVRVAAPVPGGAAQGLEGRWGGTAVQGGAAGAAGAELPPPMQEPLAPGELRAEIARLHTVIAAQTDELRQARLQLATSQRRLLALSLVGVPAGAPPPPLPPPSSSQTTPTSPPPDAFADAATAHAMAYRTLVSAARQTALDERAQAEAWWQITAFGMAAFGFSAAPARMG